MVTAEYIGYLTIFGWIFPSEVPPIISSEFWSVAEYLK